LKEKLSSAINGDIMAHAQADSTDGNEKKFPILYSAPPPCWEYYLWGRSGLGARARGKKIKGRVQLAARKTVTSLKRAPIGTSPTVASGSGPGLFPPSEGQFQVRAG